MFAAPMLPLIPTVSNAGVSNEPLWPDFVLLAFTVGMLLGMWLASPFVIPPGNHGGWGRPPKKYPEPPCPKGTGEDETSWIDDVERFLAEQLAPGREPTSGVHANAHPTRPSESGTWPEGRGRA